MKIRIKGNSIRTGYLEEATEFGNTQLTYALERKDSQQPLSAVFEGNKITLFMHTADAHNWTNTERVGYEANMNLGNGKQLYLLLEKDFKCLDNTNEDQSDMYENPLTEFHK
jgi:hypothetical protein